MLTSAAQDIVHIQIERRAGTRSTVASHGVDLAVALAVRERTVRHLGTVAIVRHASGVAVTRCTTRGHGRRREGNENLRQVCMVKPELTGDP